MKTPPLKQREIEKLFKIAPTNRSAPKARGQNFIDRRVRLTYPVALMPVGPS